MPALAAVLLLAVALSGCAYLRTTQLDTFAGVDEIAAEVDVDSLGTATSMEYSGSTRYGEPEPTLRMVIAGEDVVVNLEARLANAGFERPPGQDTAFHYWERADDVVRLELLTEV